MKKLTSIIMAVLLALSLVACGGDSGTTSGIDKEAQQILESAGIDPNDFAQYSPEKQEAILRELGIASGNVPDSQSTPKPEKPQLSHVSGNGNYVVTVSDSMMWNCFELYYEDGVLVKIVTSFQKNSEEEAMVDTVEGADACAACGWFFLDYTAAPEQLVEDIKNAQGYTNVYIEKLG